MSEKTPEKPAPAEKPKTHVEAKRVYDALAAQVTEHVKRMPKIRVEIEARVKKEMGDAETQLAEMMKRKGVAAKEMFDAEEREKPEREAKVAAEAKAKAEAKAEAHAAENAARHKEEAKETAKRLREAAHR